MNKTQTLLDQFDRINRLMRRQKNINMPRRGRRFLELIQQNPNITTKDLALKLDIRVSSLNERLNRYIDSGLVERKRNEEDMRTFGLSLTESGQNRLNDLKDQQASLNENLKTILDSQEQTQLSTLLDKLIDGLRNNESEESR